VGVIHMQKLCSNNIYLATLEKEHCRRIWDDFEYDFEAITEPLNIGHSSSKADLWFDEIQRDQGNKHIRLGIFLLDGTVIGDVALQDVDWKNRSCSIVFCSCISKNIVESSCLYGSGRLLSNF
jgi:RimJ/RimL family protein N-acetyltransferase